MNVLCSTVLVETSPQAMPLGAACVASSIKADPLLKDLSVSLVDFSMEDIQLKNAMGAGDERECGKLIAESLSKKNPGAVCFSVYVWNHEVLDLCAGELKKLSPNCVMIAGGPEVTANPWSFKNFDFLVAGQGEISVPLLLQNLFTGTGHEIQGVYRGGMDFKNSSSVERSMPCPIEKSVSPYLDGTLDPSKYGGALWELARGCPFKCSYCYESKGEKNVLYFPMERLEREIDLFVEKKVPQVFVLDPTYNTSKERAVKILKILGRRAPDIFFYFEARAEYIDREMAKAFSKVRCCIQFGLQSANPDVLKNVHRTLDRGKFAKNVGYLNQEGVTFGFDLIYGLPGDNLSGFKKSIDFALSLYPNNLELFCLSVLPGTKLHDDAPGFKMVWDEKPPYHVVSTPGFSERDLALAEKLASATNLFYTQGRAVPWFNSVVAPLGQKSSEFLWGFANFVEGKNLSQLDSMEIQNLQSEYVRLRYKSSGLDKLIPLAEDLIKMHGALGRCVFDGSEGRFTTSYHPDDLMSEYASDLVFFQANAGKQKCRVVVFEGSNGVDWRVEDS